MFTSRKNFERIVDARVREETRGFEARARAEIRADYRERIKEPGILAGAISLALRSTVDEHAHVTDGEEFERNDTLGKLYRFGGGNLLAIVLPYDEPRLLRFGDNNYLPLDSEYRRPQPDATPPVPAVSGGDIKAWIGYARTVAEGFDPALSIDMDNDGLVSPEAEGGRLLPREHLALIGHRAIMQSRMDPQKFVKHIQNHIEECMLGGGQAARDLTPRSMDSVGEIDAIAS